MWWYNYNVKWRLFILKSVLPATFLCSNMKRPNLMSILIWNFQIRNVFIRIHGEMISNPNANDNVCSSLMLGWYAFPIPASAQPEELSSGLSSFLQQWETQFDDIFVPKCLCTLGFSTDEHKYRIIKQILTWINITKNIIIFSNLLSSTNKRI